MVDYQKAPGYEESAAKCQTLFKDQYKAFNQTIEQKQLSYSQQDRDTIFAVHSYLANDDYHLLEFYLDAFINCRQHHMDEDDEDDDLNDILWRCMQQHFLTKAHLRLCDPISPWLKTWSLANQKISNAKIEFVMKATVEYDCSHSFEILEPKERIRCFENELFVHNIVGQDMMLQSLEWYLRWIDNSWHLSCFTDVSKKGWNLLVRGAPPDFFLHRWLLFSSTEEKHSTLWVKGIPSLCPKQATWPIEVPYLISAPTTLQAYVCEHIQEQFLHPLVGCFADVVQCDNKSFLLIPNNCYAPIEEVTEKQGTRIMQLVLATVFLPRACGRHLLLLALAMHFGPSLLLVPKCCVVAYKREIAKHFLVGTFMNAIQLVITPQDLQKKAKVFILPYDEKPSGAFLAMVNPNIITILIHEDNYKPYNFFRYAQVRACTKFIVVCSIVCSQANIKELLLPFLREFDITDNQPNDIKLFMQRCCITVATDSCQKQITSETHYINNPEHKQWHDAVYAHLDGLESHALLKEVTSSAMQMVLQVLLKIDNDGYQDQKLDTVLNIVERAHRTVDKKKMNKLRSYILMGNNVEKKIESDEVCSLCLQSFKTPISPTRCKHVFCVYCFVYLLLTSQEDICPQCRTSFGAERPYFLHYVTFSEPESEPEKKDVDSPSGLTRCKKRVHDVIEETAKNFWLGWKANALYNMSICFATTVIIMSNAPTHRQQWPHKRKMPFLISFEEAMSEDLSRFEHVVIAHFSELDDKYLRIIAERVQQLEIKMHLLCHPQSADEYVLKSICNLKTTQLVQANDIAFRFYCLQDIPATRIHQEKKIIWCLIRWLLVETYILRKKTMRTSIDDPLHREQIPKPNMQITLDVLQSYLLFNSRTNTIEVELMKQKEPMFIGWYYSLASNTLQFIDNVTPKLKVGSSSFVFCKAVLSNAKKSLMPYSRCPYASIWAEYEETVFDL